MSGPKNRGTNKYGRKGTPVNWATIKALWIAGKHARELAVTFGVNQSTLETRASRERWRNLRQKMLEEQIATAKIVQNKIESIEEKPESVVAPQSLSHFMNPENGKSARSNEEVVRHAAAIAGADTFRSRVIAANEKALKVLEEMPPTNVGEVDRFAEALTKVERIGARSYGYEREQDRPVVNIGVLTTGSEYDF